MYQKKIMKFFNCVECKEVLINKNNSKTYTLIDIKNRGGLTKPSENVIKLFEISEKVFMSRIHNTLNSHKNLIDFLVVKVMSNININEYLKSLSNHIYTQSPINNHLLQLIKIISNII